MATSLNTHGAHQEIHVGKFGRDRIGIITGSVQRHKRESKNEQDFALLRLSAAPTGLTINNGVPPVNVERNHDGQAWGVYTYTYEGFDTGYDPSESEVTFELDITMSEDPIQTHPNFKTLADKYGWLAGKRQFPEFPPAKTSGDTVEISTQDAQNLGLTGSFGTGLSGALTPGNGSARTRSRMYGEEAYLAVGAHYRVIYARRAVPADATNRVNEIVSAPKGLNQFVLPGWARRRNWLYLGPRISLRGNVSQISEEYWLSGPRGWNPEVYGRGKL